MKNLLLIGVLLLIGFSSKSQSIIPQPVNIENKRGNFVLKSNASISYNKKEAKQVAAQLADKLNVATGYTLKSNEASKGTIILELLTKPNAEIGNEGYILHVESSKVKLVANTTAGLFYGMQSLIQLFPPEIESKTVKHISWSVPCVEITDYPRFTWRGYMLDVSRHFFTKEEVKAHINQLAQYKYNVFHWHLTDDEGWRVEIKSLPKLTQVGAWRVSRAGKWGERPAPQANEKADYGGFYTQEDIKEIVEYANQRHVTIVPEIDVPGHSMAAVASYPELSCTNNAATFVNPGTKTSNWYGNGTFKMLYDNTLNPANEQVYVFLDKVFTELAQLFPGSYIHVGGDECYKGIWAQDSSCQMLMKKLAIRHVEDLQGYFMHRVETILAQKGKKMIGWDEILEGGISPTAAVMSWRGLKGGIEASQLKHPVVMSPNDYAYLDFNQGEKTVDPAVYANLRISQCYAFNPIPKGANAQYILGAQGNMWTEQIPTVQALQYMSYPRAWALSEVFWSPQDKRSWEGFVPRMLSHFIRADAAKINYSTAIYDAIVKTSFKDGKLMMMLSTEIDGLTIYYTIDNTMPTKYSAQYTKAVEIPNAPVIVRIITYKNDNPIGHLITLSYDELLQRAHK